MKIKFLPLIAALFTVTPIVTSCLDSDEVVVDYGSETSITSFTLGTLNIDRIGKDKNGEDSAYVDTLDCSNYPFTINQVTRTIENKDSLPVGIRLDKVIVNLTADTEIIAYEKNGQDTTWVSTDSIDFTVTADHAVKFRVYTYDFKKGAQYTIKINRHEQDPDSISWKDFNAMQFGEEVINQKAIFANNTLFVFGNNLNGTPAYFYSSVSNGQPTQWEKVDLTANSITSWDAYSATLGGETIYLKNASGQVIHIDTTNPTDISGPNSWQYPAKLLIASGIYKDTECFFAGWENNEQAEYGYIKDGNFYKEETPVTLFDKLLSQPFFSVTEPMAHNSSLSQTTVLTYNNRKGDADTCALVFHRLSTDTKWSEFEANQSSGCPNLKNIVMIPYDGKLYAFGGESQGWADRIAPFETFYVSTDYGRTWQESSEKVYLPDYFAERYDTNQAGCFSCTVDNTENNHFIWVIWKDGEVTRGRINRLGFLPKEW